MSIQVSFAVAHRVLIMSVMSTLRQNSCREILGEFFLYEYET